MNKNQLKQIFEITKEIGENDNRLISKRWSTFTPMRGLVDTPSNSYQFSEFVRDSKSDGCVEFVKEIEGEIISTVAIMKKLSGGITGYSPWKEIKPFCFLTDVWTHPNHRGQGYVSEMIPMALEYAKKQWNQTHVLLGVTSLNAPARHVYEKAGFKNYAFWMSGIPSRDLWKEDDRFTFDTPRRMADIKYDPYCKQTFVQQAKFNKMRCELLNTLAPNENALWSTMCDNADWDKKNGRPINRCVVEHEGRLIAIQRTLNNYPTIWHLSVNNVVRLNGLRDCLPLFSKIFDDARTELEQEGYLTPRDLTCLWYPTLDCSLHYVNDAMAHGFIDTSIGMYRRL